VRVTARDQQLPLADVLREFPARRVASSQPDQPDTVQGLPVRVVVERTSSALSARGEMDLGESSRLYPSDQALARFKELMPQGQPQIVYGEG